MDSQIIYLVMMGFVVKKLRMLLFFGGSFFGALIDNWAIGEMAICLLGR